MKRKNNFITVVAVVIAFVAMVGAVLAYQDAQKRWQGQAEMERELAALKEELSSLKKERAKEPAAEGILSLNTLLGDLGDLGSVRTAPRAGFTPVPRAPAPRILVEPEVLDLGTIRKADGPVQGTFVIRNTGDVPLTLEYVFSSCGCTTADVENKVVPPGETFELPVTYDPNYFGPSLELGSVKKWISIYSDDPGKPFYKVNLKANVVP